VRLERRPWCGVAAARNHAIGLASGEFIAPMDADDLWHPTKLERQLERFYGDPEMGLVYSWYRSINTNSLVLEDGPQPAFEGWMLQQHLEWNFVGNGSAPMFRTKALSGLGYEPSLQRQGVQGCEDYLLQIQVSRHWRFGCAPGFLIGYRRSPNSMSADFDRMLRSHVALHKILEAELSGSERSLCRRKGVEYLLRLARIRTTAGRFGEATRMLREAFYTDVAHCLRTAAVEYGQLPARALRKLRRNEPIPIPPPSTAFLDLDPNQAMSAADCGSRIQRLRST
jgi:glycosyltransferase involved in cell wall biosynthesis